MKAFNLIIQLCFRVLIDYGIDYIYTFRLDIYYNVKMMIWIKLYAVLLLSTIKETSPL